MPKVTLQIKGLEKIQKNLDRLHEEARESLKKALKNEMLKIMRVAIKKAPVDTGLGRNTNYTTDAINQVGKFVVEGGFVAEHMLYVHEGTRPHTPPLDPILGWVNRKLGIIGEEAIGVARSIQNSIRLRGTGPNPFFVEAINEVRNEILRDIRKILKEELKI